MLKNLFGGLTALVRVWLRTGITRIIGRLQVIFGDASASRAHPTRPNPDPDSVDAGSPGPPAHWLELVRERAPHLLDAQFRPSPDPANLDSDAGARAQPIERRHTETASPPAGGSPSRQTSSGRGAAPSGPPSSYFRPTALPSAAQSQGESSGSSPGVSRPQPTPGFPWFRWFVRAESPHRPNSNAVVPDAGATDSRPAAVPFRFTFGNSRRPADPAPPPPRSTVKGASENPDTQHGPSPARERAEAARSSTAPAWIREPERIERTSARQFAEDARTRISGPTRDASLSSGASRHNDDANDLGTRHTIRRTDGRGSRHSEADSSARISNSLRRGATSPQPPSFPDDIPSPNHRRPPIGQASPSGPPSSRAPWSWNWIGDPAWSTTQRDAGGASDPRRDRRWPDLPDALEADRADHEQAALERDRAARHRRRLDLEQEGFAWNE